MSCGSWDCIVQGSSPHKCSQESSCSALNTVVAAFHFRYFSVLINSRHAQSLSLSLKLFERSTKPSVNLLDQVPLVFEGNDLFGPLWFSSDYPLRLFPGIFLPPGLLPNRFLLFGHIVTIDLGPRPNTWCWAFTPTIAPQNFNFSLASEEKKEDFDLLRNKNFKNRKYLSLHVYEHRSGRFIIATAASIFPMHH